MPGIQQYLHRICAVNRSLTLHQALKKQLCEMSALAPSNKAGSVEPLIKAVYSSTGNAALKSMAQQTIRYGVEIHIGFIALGHNLLHYL